MIRGLRVMDGLRKTKQYRGEAVRPPRPLENYIGSVYTQASLLSILIQYSPRRSCNSQTEFRCTVLLTCRILRKNYNNAMFLYRTPP